MRIISALLVVALMGSTGCYRTHIIPVDELQKLDGVGMPQPWPPEPPPGQKTERRQYRVLQAADGSRIEFERGMELILQAAGGPSGGHFSRILVTTMDFDGELAGSGQPIHLALGSIQYAQVQALDGLATAALVGSTILVLLAGGYGFLLSRQQIF